MGSRSGHPPFRNKPSRRPQLPSDADGLSWWNSPELPIAMPAVRTRLQLEVDICACRSMRWSTLFEERNFGRSRHHLLESCIRWNGLNVSHSQWSVTAPDNNVAFGLLAVIVPGDGSDGFVPRPVNFHFQKCCAMREWPESPPRRNMRICACAEKS